MDKALAGLSPEEQEEVVEEKERAIKDRYQQRTDRDQFAERNARCKRLWKKMRKEVAGYGDGAQVALEVLDSLGHELEMLAGEPI